MDNKRYKDLHTILSDYFKDIDNKTLIKFIECFAFHIPTKNAEINSMVEKFLQDNELEESYSNYVKDFVKKESTYFIISDPSERDMIEGIKRVLMDISFNRFRNMDFPVYKNPMKVEFNGSGDIEKGTVCIKENIREEYTLCGTLIEGDYSGNHTETDKKVNCPHCKTLVKYCKQIPND